MSEYLKCEHVEPEFDCKQCQEDVAKYLREQLEKQTKVRTLETKLVDLSRERRQLKSQLATNKAEMSKIGLELEDLK